MARTPVPAPLRFARKVRPAYLGCWQWIGGLNNGGYGSFDQMPAHRWAYSHFIGPIPEGYELDHRCQNRACVNPLHLEPALARDHIRRSGSPSGINARRTHCVNGHEFTAENIARRDNGGRKCKACARAIRAHRSFTPPIP
jgi:hypothetical protein